VILGLDPSKNNVGWALLCDDTGLPVSFGTERLDVDGGGWMEHQVSAAFESIEVARRSLKRHVMSVAIEDPFAMSMSNAKAYGAVMALCQSEWHRRWGDIEFRVYLPKEWRKQSGIPGNASKGLVRYHSNELCIAAQLKPKRAKINLGAIANLTQDECDAIMIARAFYVSIERERNNGN
jgi:Holliday junction resolvasome RuvABC endonuclease subunit